MTEKKTKLPQAIPANPENIDDASKYICFDLRYLSQRGNTAKNLSAPKIAIKSKKN